ncbi:MAG: hypothetical protein LC635_03135, partial [Pseudonocardiaceae bacterium]|nr:hypothetical protein [Pseudonocardiaceae bacterium]
MTEAEILTAVESGVCAVARRAEATPDVLVRLVKAAAAGEGALPPDLLGGLLDRVSRLPRHVLEPRDAARRGHEPGVGVAAAGGVRVLHRGDRGEALLLP